jgi:hypothetical protein
MRSALVPVSGILLFAAFSCVPVHKIARHDFDSGIFKLETEDAVNQEVYTKVSGDSITVYPLTTSGSTKVPDINGFSATRIGIVSSENYFYKSRFTKNSIDADLTTILLKYRPEQGDVPNQLSSNLNAALYVGLRKDFFKIIPYKTPLKEEFSFLRHTAFDAGFFAGIGITPVNPTVTSGNVNLEYDGIVFQKGIAGYITFANMSIGITLGFDTLLDKNRKVWLFSEKPYLGIAIGISNF